jgi:hypothetical protein
MRTFLLSLCVTGLLPSLVASAAPTPPSQIDRATYSQWLTAIGAPVTPYYNYMFSWYEAQAGKPLPAEVMSDPDKLFVTIDAPLAEAIRVEETGDAEEGTTYGLETYGVIDAPIATVLEATLFRWGKPVGQQYGVTHPNDTVFGFREEKLTQEWGTTSYKTYTLKHNGGVANNMDDTFSLLVRGDAQKGYTLAGSFLGPNGDTTTSSFITIIVLKPTADGKTDYRISGMQTGQNYSFFGVEMGRRNFGFNVSRIRAGQKDFYSQVKALRDTGKIPEKH